MQHISQALKDYPHKNKGPEKHSQSIAFMKEYRKSRESMQQTISAFEKANEDIIRRLIHICMFKDNEIGNHILRVGEISRFLAGATGLPPEEASFIGIAAPMHDIGKLGIPDSILYKPGVISANEYEIIKTHTLIGGSIFKNPCSPEIEYARQVSVYHHERWDGQGYPYGLAGEDIPLAARITAVADVFDVILSWRSYKNPSTETKAAQTITRNKGTQFDPLVVEAFADNLKDVCRIRNNMLRNAESAFTPAEQDPTWA